MKTIRWMSSLVLLLCAGVLQSQNYRSYVLDTNIAYQWEDFNPLVPTEVLALAGEDEVYAINLPFPFRFFDSTYTTAFVGINGYISFGRNYNQSDFNREHLCNPVPQLYNPAGEQNSLNPDNFIAVFWDDLALDGVCMPLDGGTPKLAYRVIGTAPNRVLVVVWDYFVHTSNTFPCATQTPEFAQQLNVQVKLFEGTNVIEVHLKNNQLTEQEATIAVENAAGDYAEYAHCSAANPPPAGPKAYRFTPSLDAPTGGPSSAYCTARGEDCSLPALRWISNVSISNLSNRSTCSNQGYSDYTNLGPIRMDTGTVYSLTVNTQTFTNPGYITRVWVDWNQDTLFGIEELTQMVGTSSGAATGEGVFLAQLTPPPGTQTGIYRMRIRHGFATNNIEACGPDDLGEVEDYHIAVNTPAGYCAAQGGTCPGPDLENPNFDHIINFQATTNGNDVSNLSNCNNGYGDFTADQNLWVNWDLEGNYTVVIKRLVPDYINAKAGLWIDWNQDSDFDDSGERFLGVANILDSTTTFPILVPQDAVLGNTRLRVRTTSSLTDDARPCGVQAFGEVEDYTVVIFDPSLMPPTCANIISPAADAQNLCQTVNLVWNSVDNADGYKLTLRETNPDVFLQNEFSTTDTTFTPAGRLTPGKTYAWIVVPFNQDGDAPSCDTVRFTIAPNGDPIANLLPNVDTAFVCANNTLQLDGNLSNGTAPFTHLWTGLNASLLSSTTIVNPVFTGASTGNFKYNYDVTDQNGCSSKDSIVISIIPEVIGGILNADDPKICVGESTLIRHRSYVGNVQIQDSIAGGAWADVDLLSPNADVYATGTLNQTRYYRAVVGSSTCGDTSNVIEVVVNAIPAAPLVQASGPTTFCNGDSVSLSVTNYTTGLVWNDIRQTANRTLVVKTAGNYSVTYTDVNGCVSTSASTSVTTNPVPNKPQVQFLGKSNTCAGDSVLLFVNNPNGDALLWNDAAGTTNDTLVVKTAGNYFVVASAAGCSNQSDPVSVPFDFTPDRPVITPLGSTLLCEGDQLQITSSYSTGIVWSTGETNDTITLSNTGTYSVTYTDPAGCTSVSELFSVSFTPAPPKPGIILVGDSLRSTVESFTYQWIGPFGPINGATNRSYKPTTTGDYRVVVYTLEGCTSEQSDPYYIGFTGVNEWKGGMVALYPNPVADKLTVEHSEQDVYSFEIYNALGQVVKHLVSSDKRVVFDLSDLAAGPYQFRMVGSNGAINKTIIRQ